MTQETFAEAARPLETSTFNLTMEQGVVRVGDDGDEYAGTEIRNPENREERIFSTETMEVER